jgi:hypothetical protein
VKALIVFILIVFLSYAGGKWLKQADSKMPKQSIIASSCNPVETPCNIKQQDLSYIIRFSESPSALRPFVIQLNMQSHQPKSIDVSFEMDGMNMGYNIHHLIKNNTLWQAKVILPVCSLGRNDWLLRVKIALEKEVKTTEFKFTISE